MLNIRFTAASVVMAVLWALITLQTHAYYDVITWTCFGVSCAAFGVMFYNYLRFCQKLVNGEIQLDHMSMMPQ